MEVDHWLNGNLGLDIALALGRFHFLNLSVVGCHVGVMMLGVVQLHDLARNCWLKSSIVVCICTSISIPRHSYASIHRYHPYKLDRVTLPCHE